MKEMHAGVLVEGIVAGPRILAIALGIAMIIGHTGCQKVLFQKEDPRTQFETHDRLRQRYIPVTENNVFGEPQPALRARLSPEY